MLWVLFYIVLFLSQLGVSYEIDEHDLEMPEYLSSVEEYNDVLSPIFDSAETSDNQYIEESQDLIDKTDSDLEDPPEDIMSFAGPVKAKGTVTVAATFGYDSSSHSGSSPASNFNQPWLSSPIKTQYFPSSPLLAPIPFTLSHIPLLSIFLPGMSNEEFLENTVENYEEATESKSNNADTFLELLKTEDAGISENLVELLLAEQPKPVVFLDEDVRKISESAYDEADYHVESEDQVSIEKMALNDGTNEPSYGGVVFGGFVPASGTVTIAARF